MHRSVQRFIYIIKVIRTSGSVSRDNMYYLLLSAGLHDGEVLYILYIYHIRLGSGTSVGHHFWKQNSLRVVEVESAYDATYILVIPINWHGKSLALLWAHHYLEDVTRQSKKNFIVTVAWELLYFLSNSRNIIYKYKHDVGATFLTSKILLWHTWVIIHTEFVRKLNISQQKIHQR